MANYISPFTDWGFKRIFGQEYSKDLLISFLNDLLEGEVHIKDVTFKDKELLPESKDLRGCIFDIYCETDEGKHFIVEMQNRWVPFFINRSICYASQTIIAQREREKTKTKQTRYDIMPVYVICVMNFLPKSESINKFRTDVALREKNSESVFSDKLRFIYLSLPFFKKKEKDCETDFDKWIYVLKHMEVLERMPFAGQKKIFERLAEVANKRNLSKKEKEQYDASFDRADDYYSVIECYYDDGKKDGIKEGIEKGFEKGITKGATQKGIDIAKNLMAMGMSDAQIIQATGLSADQISKLKN